jgi:sec-independent protein translocase protein TatB
MFDVSFGELLLILIVGLLVFGPEKLPHAVRTASLWMARARRSFNQIRADIEREVGVDDIKRDIHNQSLLDSLRDVKKDLTDTQRQFDHLPYDLDRSIRENILVERAQAEIDSAHAAIPNDDFKHSDNPPGSAQELDRQNQEIANSVQPAATTATAHATTQSENTIAPPPEKSDAEKTAQRSGS